MISFDEYQTLPFEWSVCRAVDSFIQDAVDSVLSQAEPETLFEAVDQAVDQAVYGAIDLAEVVAFGNGFNEN